MKTERMRAVVPLMALCLATGGCMVASSKYDIKTKEADTLREALAATNKERNVLEARIESLQKQLSDAKESNSSLSSRVRTQEDEIRKIGEELAGARKNYEGTRITREQFISELLEKEKATGKRIQELSARAQGCELAMEKLRKESEARESELAQLRQQTEKPRDDEALRRERDILLGRVERLTEERKQEEKRRENRFAALAEAIGKVSPDIPVKSLGPALRVFLPEKVLFQKGKGGLSRGGRKVIAELGRAAAEFPSASILLSAGGKNSAEEIRAVLAGDAKLHGERILVRLQEKEKGAELLLLIP
ncbi:MAG: hypothetical protein HZA60_06175 [Deltaproteobacteria bacterium]|nr:hypothetical protein [Deltaproteobacteria bacterium]